MSNKNPFKFSKSVNLNAQPDEKDSNQKKLVLEPINFSGESITLDESKKSINRNDFKDNDKSISKEEHLSIVENEGKWILKNTSSNGYCFLQIEDEAELKNGDLIILGAKNKVFKVVIE